MGKRTNRAEPAGGPVRNRGHQTDDQAGAEAGTEPAAPQVNRAEAAEVGARVDDAERSLLELNEQYMRLAADFENFKRRKAQEMEERSRYAGEGTVREMLPVLDNLQRAMAHVPEGTDGGLIDGLTMVVREFESAFDRLGITAIATDGEPFNPSQHEAVMAEESADVDRDMVVQELQRGYRLHDRVLRPAMVKVVHPMAGASSGHDGDE